MEAVGVLMHRSFVVYATRAQRYPRQPEPQRPRLVSQVPGPNSLELMLDLAEMTQDFRNVI
jgi:hypothetical protein